MNTPFPPGSRVRHYKGGNYVFLGTATLYPANLAASWVCPDGEVTLVALAVWESDLTPCVVYRFNNIVFVRRLVIGPDPLDDFVEVGYYAGVDHGDVWVRPLPAFAEQVSGVPRFELL